MAVAMVMPTRKVVWVRKKPRKEAMTMRHMSPFSIFSFGRKSDAIQNRTPAPMARKVNRMRGETVAELAMSLHSTTFSPNMVYAAAMDRCPFTWSDAIRSSFTLRIYSNSGYIFFKSIAE